MKFGCCCRREQIESCAEAGFDYVELSAYELSCMNSGELQDVLRKLEKLRIPCLALNDYTDSCPAIVGDGFDEEKIRRYAREICAKAAYIGARCIGIGAPNARIMPVKYSYYRAFGQAVRYLQIVAQEAAQYKDLAVMMEALNYRSCNFCNTQQQALNLVTATGMSNVKLELDFYHLEMMAESYDIFGALMPYIGHLHISEKNPDDERCFFQDDNVDILKKAKEVLTRYGYEGNISVEAPLHTFSEEAARRSLRFMKEYLV